MNKEIEMRKCPICEVIRTQKETDYGYCMVCGYDENKFEESDDDEDDYIEDPSIDPKRNPLE